MEILFRKAPTDRSDDFITVRRIKSQNGIKTFISSGSLNDRKSIRSYELSENEIKDLADIFNKLVNCPGFLLSQDSTTEFFGEAELLE